MKNPSLIKNKAKRLQVYQKYKAQKKKTKKVLKAERLKEVEALGDAAPPKQVSGHACMQSNGPMTHLSPTLAGATDHREHANH